MILVEKQTLALRLRESFAVPNVNSAAAVSGEFPIVICLLCGREATLILLTCHSIITLEIPLHDNDSLGERVISCGTLSFQVTESSSIRPDPRGVNSS